MGLVIGLEDMIYVKVSVWPGGAALFDCTNIDPTSNY